MVTIVVKAKSHLKTISILVVIIFILALTSVVLFQPVTVKSPDLEEGIWTVDENETYAYYGLMFIFHSLNYTHISGMIKSNSTGYQIFLMTPGQMFEWLNESNRSVWKNKDIRGMLNETDPIGTATVTTNLTPNIFLNSEGGSGNLELSWNLITEKNYVLLFISQRGTDQVLSINSYLKLSYTHSII